MAEARTLDDPGPIDPELRERALRAAVEVLRPVGYVEDFGDDGVEAVARIALDGAWEYLMSASSLWMLDHMRETLLADRTELKMRFRELEAEVERLRTEA